MVVVITEISRLKNGRGMHIIIRNLEIVHPHPPTPHPPIHLLIHSQRQHFWYYFCLNFLFLTPIEIEISLCRHYISAGMLGHQSRSSKNFLDPMSMENVKFCVIVMLIELIP